MLLSLFYRTKSSTSQAFSTSGGTGSVSVTTNSSLCTWTATSNVSWITITSGSSGTAAGTVNYSFSDNRSGSDSTVLYIGSDGSCHEGYCKIDEEGGEMSFISYVLRKKRLRHSAVAGDTDPKLTILKTTWDLCRGDASFYHGKDIPRNIIPYES